MAPGLRHGGLALVGLVLGLLVARAPLTLVFVAVGGLGVAAVTLAEPLVGIGLALVVGPSRAYLSSTAPGLAPQAGQAVFALVVVAWLARGLWRRDLRLPRPPLVAPLWVFLGVGLLTLWSPVDIWVGFQEWVKWVEILVVALIAYDRLQVLGRRAILLLLGFLCGSVVVQALIGLWQFGVSTTIAEHFAINDRFFRAYGTFEQPNPYAGFVGMVGALLVGVTASRAIDLWREGGWVGWRRVWHAVRGVVWIALPAVLAVAALVASWSRGGWMGFGAALLVMIVFLPRHNAWGAILVVGAVALVGGLYTTGHLPPSIVNRLTGFLSYTQFQDVRGVGITNANFAVVERMAHWQAALSMWRSHFWLGVGLGCYEPAYPAYRLINWPIALGHAHNAYLNFLAETGLVGLSAYVAWWGTLAVGLVVALRRAGGWSRALAVGLLGAWTQLAVHSLVDNLLVNNVNLVIGVLVALSAYSFELAAVQVSGDGYSPLREIPVGEVVAVAGSVEGDADDVGPGIGSHGQAVGARL